MTHDHCGCGHDHDSKSSADQPAPGTQSWLSGVLASAACLLCPSCVALWGSGVASMGVVLPISEAAHHWLLAVALLGALLFALYDAKRSGIYWGTALVVLAIVTIVSAHVLGLETVETLGAVFVFLAPWVQRTMVRKARVRSSVNAH